MNAAMPTNEPALVQPRLWAKPRAFIAVVFVGFFTLVSLLPHAAPSQPQAEFITAAMLAVMWVLALWAVLGVRARTIFSAAGVADVRVMRTVSLPWELITNCTVVEKTLRPGRGPSIHGVLIRFASQRSDHNNSIAKLQPRDHVIELFVPDAMPLAPGIVVLLRTIPQVSHAPWELLEPTLRRPAAVSDRNQP